MLDSFLKNLVSMLMGSNALQGWDKALLDVVYALNKWPIYGAISCTTRVCGSRKTLWKYKWSLSLLPIVGHCWAWGTSHFQSQVEMIYWSFTEFQIHSHPDSCVCSLVYALSQPQCGTPCLLLYLPQTPLMKAGKLIKFQNFMVTMGVTLK